MRTLGRALCLVLCSSLHSEEAKIKCLGETSPFGLFLRHHTLLSLRSVVGCWESIFCWSNPHAPEDVRGHTSTCTIFCSSRRIQTLLRIVARWEAQIQGVGGDSPQLVRAIHGRCDYVFSIMRFSISKNITLFRREKFVLVSEFQQKSKKVSNGCFDSFF